MAETISMSEVKEVLNLAIDTNFKRQEKYNEVPKAVGIEACAGIGKTSIMRAIAEERGMKVTLVDLAQMDEPGDLIGYPQTEYEVQVKMAYKDDNGEMKVKLLPGTVWINSKQLDNPDKNVKYRLTGKTRMGYSKPAWVPEYYDNGNLVILDDYVRASPQLLQACMRLMLEQSYMSWEFPKKTQIVLTNNPDDGNYNVSSLDEAQQTKFLNYPVKWDLDLWCKWAEEHQMDGRCINFIYDNEGALFTPNENGDRICNPRSFTMFADMISEIDDWDDPKNMQMIIKIAKGCFKDEAGKFAGMFAAFIRSKAYKLPSPKEMLEKKWEEVKDKLDDSIYESRGTVFNPMISTILGKRFANYVTAWLKSDAKTPIKTVSDRLADFMNSSDKGHPFFNDDTMYYMLKTITSENKQQTGKLLMDTRIMKVLNNGYSC